MESNTFVVLKNDTFGRYMVAKKTLKQGELILKEPPALLGSHLNGPARCFKCLTAIDLLECSFCPKCSTALLCRTNCEGNSQNQPFVSGNFHTDQECQALKNLNLRGPSLVENPSIIFPLRCLLLKHYNKKLFDELMDMEAHMDQRRDTTIWRRHKMSVEGILEKLNVLGQQDSKEELAQRICGILDVNAFEVRHPSVLAVTDPEKQCLRGIYPKAALMAHNCVANTHLSVDDNFIMNIYASMDIKQGENICYNYANALHGTQERQQYLQEGKYFTCSCQRCIDPSELGTEISSLICHKCRKGLLRYVELEKGFKIWQCSRCEHRFKNFLINLALEEGRRQIEDLDPTDIQQMEALYRKLLLTFHPNHFILLELKQNMVALYSKLPPSRNNLNRKIDLCSRLMSVFSKLEPGISRIAALTMYELQSALVKILNRQYRDREINCDVFVKELTTAEKILKDAVKYLLYEPPQSPEGRMAQAAMSELKLLRQYLKGVVAENVDTSNRLKDETK